MIITKSIQILFSIVEVIFLIIISFLIYLSTPLYSTKVVYIPNGGSGEIITHLRKMGFDLSPIDKYILKTIGVAQAGWIETKKTYLTRGDFFYSITHSKAAIKKIVFVPGETTIFFLKILSDELGLNLEKLVEEYRKNFQMREGAIPPETYFIPLGITEERLIEYLYKFSKNYYEDIRKKIFGFIEEKKWLKSIVIASIIQKEAANEQEMPYVSAVIHNRIKKNMKLQMDGTLNYGLYSHTKVTKQRILEDESPYNTYKIDALPPSPVSSYSIAAIKATIFPADVDYLYFVKGEDGTHNFTNNYQEHLNNIKSVKN